MRTLSLATVLLLASPAISQAKTLDDLLVEKGVITKAEAQTAAASGASKTYWNDGTRLEFPDAGFTTKINTLIQTRYEFTDNDHSHNTSSFSNQLARLIVGGTALHEEFNYYLQTDFVGTTSSTGEKVANLKDAWLQWNTCPMSSVRMGQWKIPVSRQFNNPDEYLQFADRSVASNFFDLGRNQGIAGSLKLMDGNLTLGAGMFNGISDGEGINRGGVDTKHTGTVSARWQATGKMNPFQEGDVDWTQDMALNFGATYAYSSADQTAFSGKYDQQDLSVDANFKYQGWSFAGEFYYENEDPDVGDSAKPIGFYTQLGYYVVPKQIEVAARYGLLDCDNGKSSVAKCSGNDKVNQVTVGVSYLWWKHNLKAQFNFDHINERVLGDGDDVNTNRWLLQLQSYF